MYFLNSRFALIVTIYLIGPIQPNVAIYMLVYYTISFSLNCCFLKQRFQYGKYPSTQIAGSLLHVLYCVGVCL